MDETQRFLDEMRSIEHEGQKNDRHVLTRQRDTRRRYFRRGPTIRSLKSMQQISPT